MKIVSDNLPTAVGAYEALADLARNDIRTVAAPAATALSQATLHPEVTELHFGEIEQGSAPPLRTVRLFGPLIARACAARASHEWIRVNQTTEGFEISADTTNAASLHGTLYLKGPTGEVAITVDADVLPSAPHTPPPPREQPAGHQLVAESVAGPSEERSTAQAHRDAERTAADQRQLVEQLQQQIRERAAAHDWYAVVALNHQLAALDPAAADPDGLASTARDQLTHRKQTERSKPQAHDRAGAPPAAPTPSGPSAARKRRLWGLAVIIGGAVLAARIFTLPQGDSNSPQGSNSQAGTVSYYNLRAGNCIRGPDVRLAGTNANLPDQVQVVSCSVDHSGEVYHATDYWSGTGAYPGDNAIGNTADSECSKAFSSYVGVSTDNSKLKYVPFSPSADTWKSGDRRLVCVAYDPSGPLNRTVRGIHQ